MPLPQLWAAFFFIMIIFLGVDSEVTCYYSVIFQIDIKFTLITFSYIQSFLVGDLTVNIKMEKLKSNMNH